MALLRVRRQEPDRMKDRKPTYEEVEDALRALDSALSRAPGHPLLNERWWSQREPGGEAWEKSRSVLARIGSKTHECEASREGIMPCCDEAIYADSH